MILRISDPIEVVSITLDGIFWPAAGSGLACLLGATSAFRVAGVAVAAATIRADWAANERAWKARASGGERSSGRRREADIVLVMGVSNFLAPSSVAALRRELTATAPQ